jgi:hypothetical protein
MSAAAAVPWEAVLSSTAFRLALVIEDGQAADGAPAAAAEDPNADQDATMDSQQARIAQELWRLPRASLSPASRVSVRALGRLALALGRHQAGWAGWKEGAIIAACVAARQVGPPLVAEDGMSVWGRGSPFSDEEVSPTARQRTANRKVLTRILKHHGSSESIAAAGMGALCRLTPYSSLNKQEFEKVCEDGPTDGYDGSNLTHAWVCDDIGHIRTVGGGLATNVTIIALRTWPESSAVQLPCLRMVVSFVREFTFGREDMIKKGAIALVFRALDTFRADAAVQKAGRAALELLAETREINVGFEESEHILDLVSSVQAHPWWDEWHLDPRATGVCGATCSMCSKRLSWDRQAAKLEAWRCDTCNAANTGHAASPAKEVLLCPPCHASFESGSPGIHVAGHEFQREGNPACR